MKHKTHLAFIIPLLIVGGVVAWACQIAPVGKPSKVKLTEELVFYGLVINEKSNTVSSAQVEANVLISSPTQSQHREIMRTVSTADGRFELHIPWGQQVILTLDGGTNYISPPPQRFQYGPVGGDPIHYPNRAEPVPFVLQTRKPDESLFAFEKRYRINHDGTPVFLDLTTGGLSKNNGDLKISIHIPEPYTNLRQFPWSLNISVINGGIVETGGRDTRMEYLHEAPEGGYNSEVNVAYSSNSVSYDRQHEGWYYLKSRGGQIYAKIYFDMTTRWDERGVPFGIRAVVNTNASRYLHTEP